MSSRQCLKCEISKNLNEFIISNKLSDTFICWVCKPCYNGDASKKCKACGDIKSFSQFYCNKILKDGKMGKCKECHKTKYKTYNIKKRTYESYKEYLRPYMRNRYRLVEAKKASTKAKAIKIEK